jgi:biofilm PGA synthesis N-glycosyltransferase PgaC
MWPVILEYLFSVFWSYDMVGILALSFLGMVVHVPNWLYVAGPVPTWFGAILGSTCIVQFILSILIDRRYEDRIGRQFFWIIWYPLVYWIIGMLTTVVGVPKALLKRTGTRAVWESPDRGIR